jgi:hypothetical protein
VWLRVGAGVEILSGLGPAVWNQPAVVRNALREMLSVLPATHLQLDLGRLLGRSDPPSTWSTLLARSADWAGLLGETAAATTDGVRGIADWGIGLPSPSVVAEALGDVTDRGVLKAGLQMASFLQGFREAGIGFVAVDLTAAAVPAKVVAPIFRNGEMYGWRRAAVVRAASQTVGGAEIRLVHDGGYAEVCASWGRGELVGGGLDGAFWAGDALPAPAPPQALLFGEIPAEADAAAIVAAGRRLTLWLG